MLPSVTFHRSLRREMVMITLRTDLSRIERTNLETCITVHMHQKESTEDLMRKKVRHSGKANVANRTAHQEDQVVHPVVNRRLAYSAASTHILVMVGTPKHVTIAWPACLSSPLYTMAW